MVKLSTKIVNEEGREVINPQNPVGVVYEWPLTIRVECTQKSEYRGVKLNKNVTNKKRFLRAFPDYRTASNERDPLSCEDSTAYPKAQFDPIIPLSSPRIRTPIEDST